MTIRIDRTREDNVNLAPKSVAVVLGTRPEIIKLSHIITLLGPAARRDRLLADLGAVAGELGTRLRAPVGLKLGGRDPSSVALSIVAELQACFHGQDGRGH